MSPAGGRGRGGSRRGRALVTLWNALRGQRRRGAPSVAASFSALPRLVTAVLTRQYTGTSLKTLALMGAAGLYVVSPIDLVPELALALAGFVDDAVVLAWLAGAVLAETEAFLAWEHERDTGQPARPRREPAPAPGRAPRPGSGRDDEHEVVVGQVII